MMLLMEDEIEFKSFVANNILEFAHELRNRDITDIAKEIEGFMEYLEKTEASSPLFKRRDLPTLFMVVKKAIEEGIEPEVFGAWLEDFNNAITVRLRDKAIVKTRYKDFTSAGSVRRRKMLWVVRLKCSNILMSSLNSLMGQLRIKKWLYQKKSQCGLMTTLKKMKKVKRRKTIKSQLKLDFLRLECSLLRVF
ncbi:hypothetical protein P5624_00070 (plasmid) [Bacillus subtilis]|nr:hypothetical protein P5624_00070 [Bacillus subtilis]